MAIAPIFFKLLVSKVGIPPEEVLTLLSTCALADLLGLDVGA